MVSNPTPTPTPNPTPSPTPTPTPSPTPQGIPNGVLIGSASLNSTFNGSITLAYPSNGSMNNIAYNSGAVITGSLYVPGTPTIRRSNGTVWSQATDSQFAIHIHGVVDGQPASPRVVDLGGNPNPNYTITFNNNSYIHGKIYRQSERYSLTPLNTTLFPSKHPPLL